MLRQRVDSAALQNEATIIRIGGVAAIRAIVWVRRWRVDRVAFKTKPRLSGSEGSQRSEQSYRRGAVAGSRGPSKRSHDYPGWRDCSDRSNRIGRRRRILPVRPAIMHPPTATQSAGSELGRLLRGQRMIRFSARGRNHERGERNRKGGCGRVVGLRRQIRKRGWQPAAGERQPGTSGGRVLSLLVNAFTSRQNASDVHPGQAAGDEGPPPGVTRMKNPLNLIVVTMAVAWPLASATAVEPGRAGRLVLVAGRRDRRRWGLGRSGGIDSAVRGRVRRRGDAVLRRDDRPSRPEDRPRWARHHDRGHGPGGERRRRRSGGEGGAERAA